MNHIRELQAQLEQPMLDWAQAICNARRLEAITDWMAEDIASLIVGRLHQVSSTTLDQLKRELQGFNLRTQEWRKP